jgi:leucyl aminopeptidase
MKIQVLAADILKLQVDGLIVNLFDGTKEPGGATGAVDKALDGAITQLIADKEIKGKHNEATLIHTMGKIPAKRVVVAGLGKAEELTPDKIRQTVAEACRLLRNKDAKKVASILHGAGAGGIEPPRAAQAIAEGAILGLYNFNKHKTKEPDHSEIEELLLVEKGKDKVHALEQGVNLGRVIAEATCFARDLVNEPSNSMTPSDLAEMAKK